MEIEDFVEACFELLDLNFRNTASSYFQFGPFVVEHRGLGEASLPFFHLAITHLQKNALDSSNFIIYTIDALETGIFLPKPCWDWNRVDGFGVIKEFSNHGFYADYQFDFDTFTLIDTKRNRALQWSKAVKKLPEWERSFPFRKIIYHFTNRTSCLMLHAGAVGTKAGGVLLAGAGGSGKSSSTLACLNSGLQYAGDDFVLLDLHTNQVHSLYNVAKLDENGIKMFPELESLLYNRDKVPEQKGQLFISQHFPEKLILTFPLKCILLPKFSGGRDTMVYDASPGDVLRALAPSTLALLKADETYFSKISGIVRNWPAFHLQTGTDLPQIPLSILNLLENI